MTDRSWKKLRARQLDPARNTRPKQSSVANQRFAVIAGRGGQKV
jgi:hypothetical protein